MIIKPNSVRIYIYRSDVNFPKLSGFCEFCPTILYHDFQHCLNNFPWNSLTQKNLLIYKKSKSINPLIY